MPVPAAGAAAIHLRSYAPRARCHTHPHHQLVLSLAGSLELEIEGRGGRVARLTGVLVPEGERHAFASEGANHFLVLDLPREFPEALRVSAWFDRWRRGHFFPVPHPVRRLAADLCARLGGPSAAARRSVEWTQSAAVRLVRALAATEAASHPGAVGRALAFIERRGHEPISVRDVARAAEVSAGHLHALFRGRVGSTPRELLRALRLDRARELLAAGEGSIAEVALACGFADQATLTHAMRRVLGTTPGRLRAGAAAGTSLADKTGGPEVA